MFNVCGHCGMYTPEKEVRGNVAVCSFCGGETVFVRQPLFLLSGACGVGKTEVCRHLPALTQEVVALEGDIFWESRYNSPENKYRDVAAGLKEYLSGWASLFALRLRRPRPV